MALKKLTLGVNENVSNAEYHADREFLSSSVLKKLLDDPALYESEYIKGIAGPKKQSNALDEGSLAHTMILEPHLTNVEFQFYPGAIKKGADFEAWKLQADAVRPVISAPQLERVRGLVKAYKADSRATNLMKDTAPEFTLCTMLNDVPVKVRADAAALEAGYLVDIKTTGYSGEIYSFKQTLKDLQYDLSAALYCMVFEQVYQRPFNFYFVLLSKVDSTSHVYKVGLKTSSAGREKVMRALELYKKCKETGIWSHSQPSKQTNNSEIQEV